MNGDRFIPEILFEDNHLLVCVKPAGILSQADSSGDPDMLSLLKADLKVRYNKPGRVYLGLVHRLDRPVRGVMVFAKTDKCASRISAQIRERSIEKRYRVIVCGMIESPSGRLRSSILKDPGSNTASVFDPEDAPENAKESVLLYEVIDRSNIYSGPGRIPVTLLDVQLITGRSHQIRAQLADFGHPILGDRKYGGAEHFRGDICLECRSITLRHPIRNERMEFKVAAVDREPWTIFEKG